MKVIKPKVEVISTIPKDILQQIERIGRVAYKSEDKITANSAEKFVKMLINRGHLSVLEHYFELTVKFTVDRGVTHELVRHRLASFTQESTRYCNYSKGKFNSELVFIMPYWFNDTDLVNIAKETRLENTEKQIWVDAMKSAELSYLDLIAGHISPQQARGVLPTCVKADIVVSANLREWRHILKLRTSTAAHPQIRGVMLQLLETLHQEIPIIFDDIYTDSLEFSGKTTPASRNIKSDTSYTVVPDNVTVTTGAIPTVSYTASQEVPEDSSNKKNTAWKLDTLLANLADLLKYKNKKYGDAALNPDNVFSKLEGIDSIKVRLDDKLSRIRNAKELRKNDLADLLGYLSLLSVSKDWLTFNEFKD